MFGRVYIFGFGDRIKIGMSRTFFARHKTISSSIRHEKRELTGVFATINHINFAENEKILHDFFEEYRFKGTEYFKIHFQDAVKKMPMLYYKRLSMGNLNDVKVSMYEKNLEIKTDDVIKRLCAYGTQTISNNIGVSKKELDNFCKSGKISYRTFISLTDFILEVEKPKYLNCYKIKDKEYWINEKIISLMKKNCENGNSLKERFFERLLMI